MRSGRIGLFGLVLLLLLVLVVAHALVMGVGHDGSEACGPCVVVLLTGLAVITAARTAVPVRSGGFRRDRWFRASLRRRSPFRAPPLHPVILRL